MATRRSAAKRKPTRKTTVSKRKTAASKKKPVTKPAKKSTTAITEPYSKSQQITHIAEETCVSKKEVKAVLESLTCLIERHIKKRGAGEISLPGLVKIRVMRKPATKARKGINPFTGEMTTFKAKPARNVVKVRALKKLKDMVK